MVRICQHAKYQSIYSHTKQSWETKTFSIWQNGKSHIYQSYY